MKTKNELLTKLDKKEAILGEPLPVYRDMVLLEDSDERSDVSSFLYYRYFVRYRYRYAALRNL
jgi:hypothetical protein